jgi:hypothetical protein
VQDAQQLPDLASVVAGRQRPAETLPVYYAAVAS